MRERFDESAAALRLMENLHDLYGHTYDLPGEETIKFSLHKAYIAGQAATADMDELLVALRMYGQHLISCPKWNEEKTCNCGFEAVLARYGKS